MKRREFITLFGGAAATWPLAARAQQTKIPKIAFLNGFSSSAWTQPLAAFHKGLNETGYVESQNVAVEYRWAENQPDRLRMLAAELVRSEAAVLIATGGSGTAIAAKQATATIPIVFGIGADPVRLGLVASLSRPRGNATGVYFFAGDLDAKRLGLLRELVPRAALIAVLVNPTAPTPEFRLKEIEAAARNIGQKVHISHATSEREIDAAFATFSQVRAAALLVGGDPFFLTRRDQIVALAARHAIPAIYDQREYAVAGGLTSYGTSLTDAHRQIGIYAGRVLKGEKPAELPVIQSTRFEFVINLKTAKALGLDVPPGVSAHADEVIE